MPERWAPASRWRPDHRLAARRPFSGRLYLRIGFRDTAFVGGAVVVAARAGASCCRRPRRLWAVAGVCFVAGVGMGLIASPTMVAVQSFVGWAERGLVTGTAMFSRSLGSAVGVAAFGALVTAMTTSRFAPPPPGCGTGCPRARTPRASRCVPVPRRRRGLRPAGPRRCRPHRVRGPRGRRGRDRRRAAAHATAKPRAVRMTRTRGRIGRPAARARARACRRMPHDRIHGHPGGEAGSGSRS